MGILKWIDRHIRQSNAEWHEGYKEAERKREAKEAAEQKRLDNLECCANCEFFMSPDRGFTYKCTRHNFRFDTHEVRENDFAHKRVCDGFIRKRKWGY